MATRLRVLALVSLACSASADPFHWSATADSVQLIPHYRWWLILIAFIISVLGSWTTIELLLRRTSNTGLSNAVLLLGAAANFAAVSTFSMHFVGNAALVLYNPNDPTRTPIILEYSIGYTVLSLFVSVIAVSAAFIVLGLRIEWLERIFSACSARLTGFGKRMGRRKSSETVEGLDEGAATFKVDLDPARLSEAADPETGKAETATFAASARSDEDLVLQKDSGGTVTKASLTRILVSGTLCGLSVCGMHYIGDLAILAQHLHITYNPGLVVLSVLIACIAVCVGEYILFVLLAPLLRHPWWRRLGVAVILAIAVNSMHWCARGATYYFADDNSGTTSPSPKAGTYVSDRAVIAFAACLAPLSTMLLGAILLYSHRARRRSAKLRRRMVLAAVIFDDRGRILTTTDGRLPLKDLKGLEDFDMGERRGWWHRFWGNGSDAVPLETLPNNSSAFAACMEAAWVMRVNAAMRMDERTSSDAPQLSSNDVVDAVTASLPFLQQRQVVTRLVRSFAEAWTAVSCLVVGPTGATSPKLAVLYDRIIHIGAHLASDVEAGHSEPELFSSSGGQMMIVAFTDDGSRRAAFEGHGFSFHESGQVAKVFAGDMGLRPESAVKTLTDVRQFVNVGLTLPRDKSTVYAGVFLAQALAHDGLQIMVDPLRRHSMPMTPAFNLSASGRPATASEGLDSVALQALCRCLPLLAGQSLHDMAAAAQEEEDVSDAELVQIREHLVATVLSLLENAAAPATMQDLLPRLRLHPFILPLTTKSASNPSSQGSYLLAFRCIVGPAVSFPPSFAFSSFGLFRAHREGLTRLLEAREGPETPQTKITGTARDRQNVESHVLTTARIFRIFAEDKSENLRRTSI